MNYSLGYKQFPVTLPFIGLVYSSIRQPDGRLSSRWLVSKMKG